MDALTDTKVIGALIAATISFVGLLISKEQKTSEFRQAWINTLRDDIARFIGKVDSVSKLILINKTSEAEEKKATSSAAILESVEMRELQSKISLFVNPKEEKHTMLLELLDKIINHLKKPRSNMQEISQNMQQHEKNIKQLTSLSQQILKEEWNRVKEGEYIFRISKYIFGFTIASTLLYIIYMLICGKS